MGNLMQRIALADEALRLFGANCDEIAKEVDRIDDCESLKRVRAQWLKLIVDMAEQVIRADKHLDVKMASARLAGKSKIVPLRANEAVRGAFERVVPSRRRESPVAKTGTPIAALRHSREASRPPAPKQRAALL